ncbi:MAG: STAS domain-containing protein [Rhodocyclaceae bacterium]
MFTLDARDSHCTVRVAGELTIFHAAQGKSVLLEAVDGYTDVDLDLSGVTELDGAGVQVLLLANREAVRYGRNLRIVAHSEASSAVIAFLSLDALFGERAELCEEAA